MIVRIEAFGRALHIEYGHTEPPTDDPPEHEDVPTPMTIPTPDYVGFVTLDTDDD